MPDVTLKQVRSANGASPDQRATLRSLKLGRIGNESSFPTPRSSRARSARSRTWSRSEVSRSGPEADGRSRPDEIGLHNLSPTPGSRSSRKRIGRGKGSGIGKTSGRGHKGAGARAGAKRNVAYEGGQTPIHMRMRKLRGPHHKMSMPFENFRTQTQPVNVGDLEDRFDAGDEVTPETLTRGRPGHAQAPGQGPRQRRDQDQAHRPRARLQRHREGEDRGCRRHRRGVHRSTRRGGATSCAADDPQRVRGPGHPQEASVHGRDPGALPARRLHPVARRRRADRQGHRGQLLRLQHPRLPEPLLGRQPLAPVAVRAGDHALHHGLDHPAAADRGRALARAPAEGGRGRAAEDHAVHALPDRRPRLRPVARLRLPLPELPGQRRHQRRRDPDLHQGLPDRDHADRRLHAADVDGRADHPARDRQRDLADDLRLDRVGPPERDPAVVDQPRSGLRGDDAVRRPGGDRRDRLRAGGPATGSPSSTRNAWSAAA